MGCKASKSADVVVVSMPQRIKDNLDPSESKQKEREDSLRGSQTSLSSDSNASRSDRESSAKSTRTADSGVGELEDENQNVITEESNLKRKDKAKVDERPSTPELSVEGNTIQRRKSPKERQVSFNDRPQSRGGMAFSVQIYPETGNVKRRPMKLMTLEKKKRKTKRRTKEEIEEKIKKATERRKEHEDHLIEKATSHKEKQLHEAKALDEFASRQISLDEST